MHLERRTLNALATALFLVGLLSALVLSFTLIAWAIVVDNSLSGWKFVAFHGAGAVLFFLGIGLAKE